MTSLVQQRWLFPAVCAVAAVAVPLWVLWPEERRPVLPPELVPFGLSMPEGVPIGRAIMAMPFSADRDPSTQLVADNAATAAQTGSTAPPQLVGLVGRVKGPAVALVRAADGATSVVRAGDEAAGWKVEAVGRDSITFSMGSNRQVVRLDYGNRQDAQASTPAGGGQP